MAPQELRYAKLHSFLPQMLRDCRAVDKLIPMSDNYEALINEAAIQICLCKAPLVTRPSDLFDHAQKLLDESWAPENATSHSIKR